MDDSPAPRARVVLLCGASGTGKTTFAARLGLPVVALDDFYRDGDATDPPLPHRFGIVDWDDPASWDAEGALAALARLCTAGEAEVPVYDIPTSRRTGARRVALGGARVVVAEGVFAAALAAPLAEAGLLADAVCLVLPRWRSAARRLLRDLAEGRKPPLVLLRRGLALARAEPALVAGWTSLGARPLPRREAERAVAALR